MREDEIQFHELLIRYADGDLSNAEIELLNAELAVSMLKREWFRQFHMDEQRIRFALKKYQYTQAVNLTKSDMPKKPSRQLAVLGVAAAVALMLVAAALWMPKVESSRMPTKVAINEQLRVNDYAMSSLVGEGLLYEQGNVRMDFGQGGKVVVEGPADFEVHDGQIILEQGMVVAQNAANGGVSVMVDGCSVSCDTGAFGVHKQASGLTEIFAFQGELTLVGNLLLPDTLLSGQRLVYDGRSVETYPLENHDLHLAAASLKLMYGLQSLDGLDLMFRREEDSGVSLLPEGIYLDNASIEMLLVGVGTFEGGLKEESHNVEQLRGMRSFMVETPKTPRKMGKQSYKGSITFDTPIIGVIGSRSSLIESDNSVQFPQVPPKMYSRGIDECIVSRRGVYRDSVTISEDRMTLHYEIYVAGQRDQFRVIVANG